MIRKSAQMRKEIKSHLRGGAGDIEFTYFAEQGDLDVRNRMTAVIKLEPGCSIGMHTHENEEEMYYILSGTGVVSDGKTSSTVSKGDFTSTKSGESHSIENNGSEPLELLAMIFLG